MARKNKYVMQYSRDAATCQRYAAISYEHARNSFVAGNYAQCVENQKAAAKASALALSYLSRLLDLQARIAAR